MFARLPGERWVNKRGCVRATRPRRLPGTVTGPVGREDRTTGELVAVDTAGSGAEVAAAERVGVVAPVALDLPLRAVRKGDEAAAERPGALVGVLVAGAVVPGVTVRIGERLTELVPADVRDRSEALDVQARGVHGIAAGVAVEIEEERE